MLQWNKWQYKIFPEKITTSYKTFLCCYCNPLQSELRPTLAMFVFRKLFPTKMIFMNKTQQGNTYIVEARPSVKQGVTRFNFHISVVAQLQRKCECGATASAKRVIKFTSPDLGWGGDGGHWILKPGFHYCVLVCDVSEEVISRFYGKCGVALPCVSSL